MGQNAGAVCRSHNDIARDMLGVTAVIVLPLTTMTLVTALPPIVTAVAPVCSVSVIVTAVAPGVISEARLKSVTSARAVASPSLRF